MRFDNNTFIVTGGASGLGEATVRALHAAGAAVVIADLNVELGNALAGELGARVAFARTNVADESETRNIHGPTAHEAAAISKTTRLSRPEDHHENR
jgi:NAD(P)-dependent dehydrogenase (short-subunit alcohol dehydrogenase family)